MVFKNKLHDNNDWKCSEQQFVLLAIIKHSSKAQIQHYKQTNTSVCRTQRTVSERFLNDPHINPTGNTALHYNRHNSFTAWSIVVGKYAVVEKSQVQTLCTLTPYGTVQQGQQDALFVFSLLWINSVYMFEHYLLTFRRRCINNNWYIACMLCMLAATRVEVELQPW
jgi:hypothetical protein